MAAHRFETGPGGARLEPFADDKSYLAELSTLGALWRNLWRVAP